MVSIVCRNFEWRSGGVQFNQFAPVSISESLFAVLRSYLAFRGTIGRICAEAEECLLYRDTVFWRGET